MWEFPSPLRADGLNDEQSPAVLSGGVVSTGQMWAFEFESASAAKFRKEGIQRT